MIFWSFFLQYNVTILYYLGLNFRIFFWIFSQIDLDSQTLLNVVKRLFRLIQANCQTFYSNEKNASAALSGLVTQEVR
jgi:hypothetical protein